MDKEKKRADVAKKIEAAKKTVQPELMKFLVVLGMESERSAVVLGAERVSASLQSNLEKFLRPCPSGGLLGSFARKIQLAYSLGLIDLKFRDALKLVLELRNAFAHAITVESLQDGKHAKSVAALFNLMKTDGDSVTPMALAFTKAAKEVGKELGDNTANYLGCIMILLLKLEMSRFHITRPSVDIPAKLDYKDPD